MPGARPAAGADGAPARPATIARVVSEPGPGQYRTTEPRAPLEQVVPRVPGDRTEEVRFLCGGNTLAGVLVLPETPGPFPAIAFVIGSGPADRTYYGMAPHLWRHFARHGFACLAWDKPGMGRSTGDYNSQTFRDRADEALAAVRFLRGRPGSRGIGSGSGGIARAARWRRWPPLCPGMSPP